METNTQQDTTMIPPEHRCTAKAKSTGQQCGRRKHPGAQVCVIHGAGSPKVKAAAARRLQEQKATQVYTTLGLQRTDVTPTEAILEEVQWTAGHVEWLRAKLQELEAEQLTWGLKSTSEKRGEEFYVEESQSGAGVSVWYTLYEKERTHLVKVCEAALRAGVEERRVQLAEQQGLLVAGVIHRILDALMVSLVAAGVRVEATQWSGMVSEIVPRELRQLS